jgi:flavin reductase (DIM6/NTAB) family NADH-FMN oxidoreductase RutF
MKKKSYPLAKVYGLLETGPVVMITTARKGRPNIMTQSWHTMIEFEPPQIACVIGNGSYSFESLRSTRECVINIPTVELAKQAVGCGNTSGRRLDKFKAFGLTPMEASTVKAPLIGECYANLECKVIDSSMANKYLLFILEVQKAWIDPSVKEPRTIHHRGKGFFMVAGKTIRLPSKMK